jgi:hypothetical protein
MAVVPVSILFEIFFASIALILYRENLTLERLVAVGFLLFEIPLLTLPQEFFIENSPGVLVETTIAFPAAIQGYVVFAMFLLVFVALYRWWELYVAQRNLKQIGP